MQAHSVVVRVELEEEVRREVHWIFLMHLSELLNVNPELKRAYRCLSRAAVTGPREQWVMMCVDDLSEADYYGASARNRQVREVLGHVRL